MLSQTKGTVLLVCLRCIDTLALVSKHAEGMSLRCDVICALAYCGRHESSHIIKAHTDCTNLTFFVGGKSHGCSQLVYSKGSHRFNETQREDYLWEFVLIYKIPCSGVISSPAASTSCRSFFITSAGIHLRSTLTVRTRLRLRTMSIGA